MVVDDIYWLDQIQSSHRSAVGDKAFYLGLLIQRGHPVIPGIVVPAIVLQNFLAHMDWQEQMFTDLPHSFLYVDATNPRQLQTIAQQIQQAILATPLPEAILSSLEAKIQQWQTSTVIFRPSFSLQSGLDPTIGCKTTGLLASHICRTDRDALAQGLKQAWSELFRAKSLFYWQRLGVQLQQVQFAVLVQPIQSVLAAGELQINGNQIQVQTVWGLGHALAQGTADRYSFDLETGLQTHQKGQQTYAYQIAANASESRSALAAWLTDAQTCLQLNLVNPDQQVRPVLTVRQLQQLSQLAQQTRAEMGMPFSLEWVLAPDAKGRQSSHSSLSFYLTQFIPQFGSPSQTTKLLNQRPGEVYSPPLPAAVPAPAMLTGLAAAPGRVVAPAWVMGQNLDVATVPTGVILIVSMITPEQVIGLRHVMGVIAEQGGMTSHAAILARELGIPAVVGVEQAMQRIQTGDVITIDGDQGEIYWGDLSSVQTERPLNLVPLGTPPLESSFTTAFAQPLGPSSHPQLYVSLSQLDLLPQIATIPVDGVGLLRSELMLLEVFKQEPPEVWFSQREPSEIVEQIAHRLQKFAVAFAPRPVFYRALDIRSHEFGTELPATTGPHPMLGMRGTFSYQANPNLLRLQLAALKQVQKQGCDNVHLVLPFVRTVEEFVFCRRQVEQAGLRQNSRFQLWIMAEVPSVLLLLPDYVAAGVQGISIGTNDLTQLLLGVDRDHPQMADAFDPYHPAVLRAVRYLVESARQVGIPCSICGQSFDRHPALLQSLLQWGITAISVDLSEIETVYRAIRQFISP